MKMSSPLKRIQNPKVSIAVFLGIFLIYRSSLKTKRETNVVLTTIPIIPIAEAYQIENPEDPEANIDEKLVVATQVQQL